MHLPMRRYTAFFVILILLLLSYKWWLTANSVVPSKSNLSVVFVGFTNNPQHTMQPVRVEVIQGATGFCALFRVTNVSTNNYIRFDTSSVEANDGRGWACRNLDSRFRRSPRRTCDSAAAGIGVRCVLHSRPALASEVLDAEVNSQQKSRTR